MSHFVSEIGKLHLQMSTRQIIIQIEWEIQSVSGNGLYAVQDS